MDRLCWLPFTRMHSNVEFCCYGGNATQCTSLQAWYLTEATEAIASVACGLCLGALSKVPTEIYKFLIEVPFAKEKSPCPFKYEVSSLSLNVVKTYVYYMYTGIQVSFHWSQVVSLVHTFPSSMLINIHCTCIHVHVYIIISGWVMSSQCVQLGWMSMHVSCKNNTLSLITLDGVIFHFIWSYWYQYCMYM